MGKKRVLIVDDEDKIRDVLVTYLTENGYETMEAKNGSEAKLWIQKGKVDMVLLDLMLPDITGEELCKSIREENEVPIIILTGKTDEKSMISGLSMGADDYIMKPFSPRNVVARIEAVLRRYRHKDERIFIDSGYLELDQANHIAFREGKELHLTPTEYKLFETLIQSPNRIFSREQLISYALEGQFNGYDRSIDTYIKSLRQKIEPDRKCPKYIKTVHGRGYRFVKE